ncbi:MAG TPA: 4-alpha-glucanotransferase, partial [Vicinamibacterales bacterium]
MPRDFFRGRHAGLLLPLFSIASRESWGIGEIGDLPKLGAWMTEAGYSFVQLLPLNEMAVGQNSPYSALTAMAIDPVFISPAAVPDVQAIGGENFLPASERDELARVRDSRAIDYAGVRALKDHAFRAGFDHFLREHWKRNTARGRQLRLFAGRERWWLDEYAVFRALHAKYGGRGWREWDAPVRDRVPSALQAARRELETEILYYTYLQWLAAEQWNQARADMDPGVFGDFPFMVSGDSADVWSRQKDFRLDASVGAPPDAFSDTGQDWGFPAYRWREIA